jgi:hypothetical protein
MRPFRRINWSISRIENLTIHGTSVYSVFPNAHGYCNPHFYELKLHCIGFEVQTIRLFQKAPWYTSRCSPATTLTGCSSWTPRPSRGDRGDDVDDPSTIHHPLCNMYVPTARCMYNVLIDVFDLCYSLCKNSSLEIDPGLVDSTIITNCNTMF